MDIKRIEPEVSAAGARSGEKRVDPGDNDFQKILARLTETSEKASPDAQAGQAIAAPPPFAVYPISMLNGPEQPGSVQAQSMASAAGVLDLLEQYQSSLGDPRISLKEMSGLVESLSRELNGLTQISEKLSPADPMKKILSEIGAVSAVEIEKFNQGRYV